METNRRNPRSRSIAGRLQKPGRLKWLWLVVDLRPSAVECVTFLAIAYITRPICAAFPKTNPFSLGALLAVGELTRHWNGKLGKCLGAFRVKMAYYGFTGVRPEEGRIFLKSFDKDDSLGIIRKRW